MLKQILKKINERKNYNKKIDFNKLKYIYNKRKKLFDRLKDA